MKVLSYGSLNYDYVYRVEHMVKEGETISSASRGTFPGGKGLNQSIALSRSGINVYHAGCVGQDGRALIELCEENGVNSSLITMVAQETGHAIIQLDDNGSNSIIIYSGANGKNTKNKIDEVFTGFDDDDWLVLQNEVNHTDYIVERGKKKGMKIVFNPSPFNNEIFKIDLNDIDYLIINEVEGFQLTGEKETEKVAESLLERYPRIKIIQTFGEKGAYYYDSSIQRFQEAFKVEVVDTTAAGDTFLGYFIGTLIQTSDAAYSMKLAAKAASIAVQNMGAISSIPLLNNVIHE